MSTGRVVQTDVYGVDRVVFRATDESGPEGSKRKEFIDKCIAGDLNVDLDNLDTDTVRSGFMKALRGKHVELVKLLLKDYRVDPRIGSGTDNVIEIAGNQSDLPMLKLLVSDPRVDKNWLKSILYSALEYHKVEMVKLILENISLDPKTADNYLWNLFPCNFRGIGPSEEEIKTLEAFLSGHSKWNDASIWHVIRMATRFNKMGLVEALLNNDNVEFRKEEIAQYIKEGKKEVIKMIIDHPRVKKGLEMSEYLEFCKATY